MHSPLSGEQQIAACFANLPKAQWCWRLMIRTPDFVAAEELDAARAALLKRISDPRRVPSERLKTILRQPVKKVR